MYPQKTFLGSQSLKISECFLIESRVFTQVIKLKMQQRVMASTMTSDLVKEDLWEAGRQISYGNQEDQNSNSMPILGHSNMAL